MVKRILINPNEVSISMPGNDVTNTANYLFSSKINFSNYSHTAVQGSISSINLGGSYSTSYTFTTAPVYHSLGYIPSVITFNNQTNFSIGGGVFTFGILAALNTSYINFTASNVNGVSNVAAGLYPFDNGGVINFSILYLRVA